MMIKRIRRAHFRFAQAALLGAMMAFAVIPAHGKDGENAGGGNWAYQCGQGQEGQPAPCRVVQNIVLQQTNQRLLTIVIEPRDGAPNHALVLALPHGVFLPAGAQIRIDEGEPLSLVIQTSDANGAYAGAAISDDLLTALKGGTQMVVAFKTAQREDLAVPVTLIGFTAAYTQLGG